MENVVKGSYKWIYGIAFAVCASGIALASAPSGALDVVNTYYTDSTHSVVVGTVEYDCQGIRTQTGQETYFQSYAATDCGNLTNTDGSGDGTGQIVGQCSTQYTPYPEYRCGNQQDLGY